MPALTDDVSATIVRQLRSFERLIGLFPDDEAVWTTRPGVANSAGNLALHVAGNLQHFIGARLGATGYVRDRPLEFSKRSGTRAEIVAELQRAADVVPRVLHRLTEADLAATFPEMIGGVSVSTQMALVHLTAHAAFHLGEAGYLRRIVTGDPTPTSAFTVTALLPN